MFALVFFMGATKDDSNSFSYNAKVETFIVGPITVMYDERYQDRISPIPRPEGDIALHQVTISLVNAKNESIPLSTLYNHHTIIVNQDTGVFIAGVGAESAGVPGLRLPLPYVEKVDSDDIWYLSAELINIWGGASEADLEVYFLYEVTYSDYNEEEHIPSNWAVIGGTGHDDVSPDCKNYQDNTCKFEYEFTSPFEDCTIVDVNAHIHIGALNITLENMDTSEVLAFAVPVYDASKSYVISIDTTFTTFELEEGVQLKITSYYDASYNFREVMSLFQLWGTFPEDPLYSEEENDIVDNFDMQYLDNFMISDDLDFNNYLVDNIYYDEKVPEEQ